MNYDTLFLTPGGINGYLLLGSIHVLEKYELLYIILFILNYIYFI